MMTIPGRAGVQVRPPEATGARGPAISVRSYVGTSLPAPAGTRTKQRLGHFRNSPRSYFILRCTSACAASAQQLFLHLFSFKITRTCNAYFADHTTCHQQSARAALAQRTDLLSSPGLLDLSTLASALGLRGAGMSAGEERQEADGCRLLTAKGGDSMKSAPLGPASLVAALF